MKKATLFFSILLLITSIFFFAFGKLNVNADNLSKTVTTTDGASIRNASPSGLRFEGVVSEPFEGTVVSYGFILSKGEYTASEMEDNYDAGKATAINAGDLDQNNKFYVSIIDIPSTGYDQDITALAYVDVDGVKTFATSSTTRNIKEVAESVNAAGKGTEFTNRICNTSVFNLNSGSFTYDYTHII